MYLLNLAFSFHLYSAASRTGYTICHRPPTLFLFTFSFSQICMDWWIYLSKLSNIFVLIANMFVQFLTFFISPEFSRLKNWLHNLSPPTTSISLQHFFCHLCRKVQSCKILLLGISPNTCGSRILLFSKPRHSTPVDSATHFFSSNLLFLIIWKANICLILEATGCHVRDILRSGVEPA